jgi:hypothetical protein
MESNFEHNVHYIATMTMLSRPKNPKALRINKPFKLNDLWEKFGTSMPNYVEN